MMARSKVASTRKCCGRNPSTPQWWSWLEYTGDKDGNGVPDLNEIGIKALKGDGDFRSAESVELLKQADIVVTNPPFSLFREYVAQLIEYEKKFIIVGNHNALTYHEVFPLIRENKMWLGHTSGDMKFRVPDHYEPRETRYWVDDGGNKWRSLGDDELANRRKGWKPNAPRYTSGVLAKYAKLVQGAETGAITNIIS